MIAVRTIHVQEVPEQAHLANVGSCERHCSLCVCGGSVMGEGGGGEGEGVSGGGREGGRRIYTRGRGRVGASVERGPSRAHDVANGHGPVFDQGLGRAVCEPAGRNLRTCALSNISMDAFALWKVNARRDLSPDMQMSRRVYFNPEFHVSE